MRILRLLGGVLALVLLAAGVTKTPSPPLSAWERALQQAVQARQTAVLAFVVYDVHIDHWESSRDGRTVLLWLALTERQTGRRLATEPGLAIAQQWGDNAEDPSAWKLTLQVDADWAETLAALPQELLSADLKQNFAAPPSSAVQQPLTFSGYRLPWAGGRAKLLEGSIGHFLIYFSCRYPSDCYYAFDFADGTMFPLLAARAGEVWRFYDGCQNGDHSCSNYIVLKDTSTTPTSYQLYLHIAHASIPPDLRVAGAPVRQGQYIANVDDTGYSTGHHLHFHVFTNPTTYYWGPSVDITFDDVSVNGGRPRTCYEAQHWPDYGQECIPGDGYVSGNVAAYPPSGGLSAPAHGTTLSDRWLTVTGWSSDREGVQRVTLLGRWAGVWHELGNAATTATFQTTLDLCTLGVPVGPLELAMRLEDLEGNVLGPLSARSLLNNATCAANSAPTCVPDADQAAIFADPNGQGACKVFDVGNYNSPGEFGSVGNNNIESLRVGNQVRLLLFGNGYFAGREESFEADDRNLADNRVQANQVSSLRVQWRSELPALPQLTLPNSPTAADSLVLTWRGEGALRYAARLYGPNDAQQLFAEQPASAQVFWSVGSLPPGSYRWQVTAENAAGSRSAESSFTVLPGSLPTLPPQSLPYQQAFDVAPADWTFGNGWTWRAGAAAFGDGSSYAGAGDLTSPPIFLPPGGHYGLRFWQQVGVEDRQAFWDQRRVQLSVADGPFFDLPNGLLFGQPNDVWLESPTFDLSAYAGQTLRLRFHFSTLDDAFNQGLGWLIDEVWVGELPPPADCTEQTPDDTLATARNWPEESLSAELCPNGDVDVYRFAGLPGQPLQLRSSGLPLQLELLDGQGQLLAADVGQLFAVLPQQGDYFVRLMAADHPGAQGSYTLARMVDVTPPTLTWLLPGDGGWVPGAQPLTVAVQAEDLGSGMAWVDFYWHSADWLNANWIPLGADADGRDGWTAWLAPALLGEMNGSALVAVAVDAAGNRRAAWLPWLRVDEQPPSLNLMPLPEQTASTAVELTWQAQDAQSGLAAQELTYRLLPGGDWQVLPVELQQRRAWWLGHFGEAVEFRLRLWDRAGNLSEQHTQTVLEAACTADAGEEDDDLPQGALAPEAVSVRNLCGLQDPDWVVFRAVQDGPFLVLAQPLGGGVALEMTLFAGDGQTQLKQTRPVGLGGGGWLLWPGGVAGQVYRLRLRSADPALAGSAAAYQLRIDSPPRMLFLPGVLNER